MRQITEIIIHCSATKAKMDIGVAQIRNWHVKDNGWQDVGYHYIIRRDGILEIGRPEYKMGAHCKNHNANSIGICLVGGLSDDGKAEDNFTDVQRERLRFIIKRLQNKYSSITKITGHNEYACKSCPCFDVQDFVRTL